MKKLLLFLAAMLLFFAESYSQAEFSTGAMGVAVNEYGRIRLSTPDATLQLQRASILVGTSTTTVFDYTNDAEALDPTVLVASPLMSDFEIYGSIDNSYSLLLPDVIVKYSIYGWVDLSYTIVKFTIVNDEANAITALAGLDIIPEINEEYGFDSVTYNDAKGVIRFHRGTQENMGMKLLSAPLTSLYSFEWFDGYTEDTNYWPWMNYGSLQPQYASNTADGPVTITSQEGEVLAPGESFDVYYAMAIGADEISMLASITAAEEKYHTWIDAVGDNTLPANQFSLGQNYPNPFSNSTTITYQLPADGFVSLKVYDAIGNEVATLVSSNQESGSHLINYNAANLASGMYYYTLKFNDQVQTSKKFMVR
jgi:hypothetical protein